MQGLTPNLWFDHNAREAAEFYTGLIPDSHIDAVHRAPADNPSTSKGAVLLVEFTLFGRSFTGINGGPAFPFTEAISLEIECDDQAEVDHYWQKLTQGGGAPSSCGWCKDRFGLSWQVVPRRLKELLDPSEPEVAERVTKAMLQMDKLVVADLEAAARAVDTPAPGV